MTVEDDRNAIVGVLLGDVKESLRYLIPKDNTQFWRRAHVRAQFAFIEGWIYTARQLALSYHDARLTIFSIGELALLRENTFELDKSGGVQVNPKFIPVEKNIRFVFRTIAKMLDVNFELDTSTTGWSAFKSALAMRNRITHPREATDLTLSDDEMETVQAGCEWFRETTLKVFGANVETASN